METAGSGFDDKRAMMIPRLEEREEKEEEETETARSGPLIYHLIYPPRRRCKMGSNRARVTESCPKERSGGGCVCIVVDARVITQFDRVALGECG